MVRYCVQATCILYALANAELLTAQPQAGYDTRRTPAISVGRGDLDYRPARESIVLKNTFLETLHIHSVRVVVPSVTWDKSPHLLFELIPFMDSLVVRAVNIGWGPYRGRSLVLFDSKLRTGDGIHSLADVFGITNTVAPMPTVNDNALLTFRLGEACVPFSVAAMHPFNVSRLAKPDSLPGPDIVMTTTSQVANFVPEYHEKGAFRYSGLEVFSGRLIPSNSPPEQVTYLLRSFAMAPHGTKNLFEGSEGSLSQNWLFAFGNIIAKPVWETKTRELVGITVDLGNRAKGEYNYNVDIHLNKNNSKAIQFEFVADASCWFNARIECVYSIGRSTRKWMYPLRSGISRHVYAPRVADLDTSFAGTQTFLRQLRSVDATLEGRASALLERLHSMPGERRAATLADEHFEWRYADAFLVALTSDNADRRHLGGIVLESIRKGKELAATITPGGKMFAIAQHYAPEYAAELALEALKTEKSSFLLTILASSQKTRPYAEAHKRDVSAYLKTLGGEWPVNTMLLAALLGLDEGISRVVGKLCPDGEPDSRQFGPFTARQIVHLATATHDPRLYERIAACLNREKLSEYEYNDVLEAIALYGDNRCARTVVAFLDRNNSEPAHRKTSRGRQ